MHSAERDLAHSGDLNEIVLHYFSAAFSFFPFFFLCGRIFLCQDSCLDDRHLFALRFQMFNLLKIIVFAVISNVTEN